MINNPDLIINPLTGYKAALVDDFKTWEKVVMDFINNFDDFDNEFQYDFIYNNLNELFTNSHIEINRKETWLDFRQKYNSGKVDDIFLDCVNSMPFMFVTTSSVFVVMLHNDIHIMYQKYYWELKDKTKQLKQKQNE